MANGTELNLDGIAIIGLAGRFPGARNTAQFWQNLAGGVESVRFFSDDDFRRVGLDPATLSKGSDFVRARSVMDEVDLFDASFFGIDAGEAELMDPQHRVFLEVAWEALEDAACDPGRHAGAIGLFAGLSLNTYLLANLCADRRHLEKLASSHQLGEFESRVAGKLNLRGPVVTVQTACSTSLVAVGQACQSLMGGQCGVALAGAVSLTFPQVRGNPHQGATLMSSDGHCRAFDLGASGGVWGDGCGIVVLKRLADALADGDCIRAVIKGAAVNHDGSEKGAGQAGVVAAALAAAKVEPECISYVEAHGTGNPEGDSMEVAALTQAFGTDHRQFCAIGSVKTNVGHLDAASGVAGLIKTTLALEHGILPPSLHFTRPNPRIDFENSPFYVNTEACLWERNGAPRRAGVSSFGAGGTNAHVILEEAPELPARPSQAGPQILVLSAKTPTALHLAAERLAAHLESHPGLYMRDVAFTLQMGRQAFEFRRFVVCNTVAEAVRLLRSPEEPEEESPQVAAGRRWLAGGEVDWRELHRETQPRRIPLPTYPFERQRYWVEPPRRKPAASEPAAPTALEGSRKEIILGEVKDVLSELSGKDLAPADPGTSFFDCGLDSLLITRAAQALGKKFGVKISFRQLADDLSCVGALVDYIDGQLPAGHYENGGALERITLQLAEIGRQIEGMRGRKDQPARADTKGTPRGNAECRMRSAEWPEITSEPCALFAVKTLKDAEGTVQSEEPVAGNGAIVPGLPNAQRGVWALVKSGEEASRACNESITLSLRGAVHLDALRQTLQFLVDRHEGLRVVVSPEGESQEILRECPIDLEIRDFSGRNGTRDAGVKEFFSGREGAPFNFSRPPLVRASVATLGDREHLLLLTFHQLAGNGASYTVFLEELAAAYDAIARGARPRLGRALQLRDFVEWSKAQESSQKESGEYWLRQFEGAIPVLELPADHPRPASRSFRGGRQTVTLEGPLVKSLRAAAAEQRCSLFMLLFTAYGVLLHRLSGQNDVVIGIAADAKIRAEEGGQSLFANTTQMMPLRCRIGHGAQFSEQVRAGKELILDASEHLEYCPGELAGQPGLSQNPGRAPLFSVTFNFASGEFRAQACGVDMEWAPDPQPHRGPAGMAMHDLSMNVAERNGGLLCELDHAEIFDAETAARWLGHFQSLLEQVAQCPTVPISGLSLLSRSEKARVTQEWNATARPYPSDALLHRLVEYQTARTPEATAVTFGGESLTYGEMNAWANRLANHLRSLGVRRDAPVAVCLARSLELPVALLAVLKAGGAYVPIDPGYPEERVAFMLKDSGAAVVLGEENANREIGVPGVRFVDGSYGKDGSNGSNLADCGAGADDLAYVLYTSGSTGTPKGSMISHRAICNHMFWMQEEFPLTERDRVLQKTPIPFDASVWEFWAPLIAGGRLVMAPPGAHRDSRELTRLAQREGITILQLVPSMAAMVVEEPELAGCATLRRIFCGGEPLSPALCEKFFERLPGVELTNLYGPAECAIDTVFHRCRRGAATVPIGRPVANTRIYVLDPDGAAAPPGTGGELHIAGAQVGRGYWNNPGLTARKFIQYHGERVYKTGDVVRWNDEGELEYLGRSDDQIKIRGQRIEPAEIEAVLRRQPGVRDCVVIARDEESGGKRLVGYVVPDRSSNIELWPSSPSAGGDQFFDEGLYRTIANDPVRNERFREAFDRTVRDLVVVEIGCGKDAMLSRLCVEAGARKVYAVELSEAAAEQARESIQKMGLDGQIVVLRGDLRTLQLPEPADVCVSENIGHVGGAEGWDLILAKAAHLLKPGAPMIPARCQTMAAAVSLPEDFMRDPKFSELAARYAGNLFAQAGYQFDLRLSITGTDRTRLRSSIGVFEDINFKAPRPWYSTPLHLTIDHASRIHGFLLWVRIEMAPGIVLDTIDHQASWLPVFLPVFPTGLEVQEGDLIDAEVTGALAENGLNRDYVIHGKVTRDGNPIQTFDFTSWHYKRVFKETPFFKTLFASGHLPIAKASPALSIPAISQALGAVLPPAMVPGAFVVLPVLPVLPNGKLDRKALPAPGAWGEGAGGAGAGDGNNGNNGRNGNHGSWGAKPHKI